MSHLDQLQERLAQLTQELNDTRLNYLREAIDPYAPRKATPTKKAKAQSAPEETH